MFRLTARLRKSEDNTTAASRLITLASPCRSQPFTDVDVHQMLHNTYHYSFVCPTNVAGHFRQHSRVSSHSCAGASLCGRVPTPATVSPFGHPVRAHPLWKYEPTRITQRAPFAPAAPCSYSSTLETRTNTNPATCSPRPRLPRLPRLPLSTQPAQSSGHDRCGEQTLPAPSVRKATALRDDRAARHVLQDPQGRGDDRCGQP